MRKHILTLALVLAALLSLPIAGMTQLLSPWAELD